MSRPSQKERMYAVGYGKPPNSSKYKKGCASPNPSGRPRHEAADSQPAAVLDRIEAEPIVIVENGKRKTITKLEAEFRRIIDQSLKGDLRAGRELLRCCVQYFRAEVLADRKIMIKIVPDRHSSQRSKD